MRSRYTNVVGSIIAVCLIVIGIHAQTGEFTFQARLDVSGLPANGNYDLEFRLYTVVAGGSAMGTATRLNVPVSAGLFSVQLSFAPGSFDGSDRYVEIHVKPAGGPTYQMLTPRQLVTSAPYAIRSQTAGNALQLGGVSAAGYVLTVDPRLTDARSPLPNSGDYIQNRATQQSVSNFNISGNGTVGGTLSGNTVNATTQFNIGGSRLISVEGLNNTYVGLGAGDAANNTGAANSFFGTDAGTGNTSGVSNSFFGALSGDSNNVGSSNSFFGSVAGQANTNGNNNAFFGRSAGQSNTSGSVNSFFGFGAGDSNTTGDNNSFFGGAAGSANTTGSDLAFFGRLAGFANTTGQDNAFFGANAGDSNTTGGWNSFFGRNAGESNTTGGSNSFFGANAGGSTTIGTANAFFGFNAGAEHTTGSSNSFFGSNAGNSVVNGHQNVFIGNQAGHVTTSGTGNVCVGSFSCNGNNTGNQNTIIGNAADVAASDLSNATAIGAGAVVHISNAVVIGRTVDDVYIPGHLVVNNLGAAGATAVCRNASERIATCSSSARYKTNISSFSSGLDLIRRLKPVAFDWKDGGMHDLGLVAEEVAAVEPLLATTNAKGEVEGVKYDRVGVILVNAVKEQQQIIERQQRQIDALIKLVCATNREADVCRK